LLPDGMDYMMRPILRRVLPFQALHSLDYTLDDFVLANNALTAQDENQRRMRARDKAHNGS
jgi:hypothetical protein